MSVLLWDQHNVGDAGFRNEQRYSVFYRDGNGPQHYVPIVAGTDVNDALAAAREVFGRPGREVFVELATRG